MITLLANNLSSFFIRKSLITAEEKDVYVFCFEILISSVLSWVSLFLLAFFTGMFKPFLYYIFWFCIFRNAAGGYHAASHFKCYMLSLLTFGLFLIFQHTTPVMLYPVYSCFFSLTGAIFLLTLAPIEHPNNPFTEKERTKHAIKTKLFTVCYLTLQIILLIQNLTYISFNMSLGCLQAAISVAIAYHLNHERRKIS